MRRHLRNTAEQNLSNEAQKAKLNITHIGQGSIKIRQEVTNTETRTKTYELDITKQGHEYKNTER